MSRAGASLGMLALIPYQMYFQAFRPEAKEGKV